MTLQYKAVIYSKTLQKAARKAFTLTFCCWIICSGGSSYKLKTCTTSKHFSGSLPAQKRAILTIRGFTHSLQMIKVKVKFNLEHAMKAQNGSRGIALLFL
jgi:hypothetical protein